MKKYLLTILLAFPWLLMAGESSTLAYKDSASILKMLKESPDKPVSGPFLLTIKSVTKTGLNTHLNTQENPKNVDNIAVVMPPFILANYTRDNQANPSSIFLNQNLILKGQIKLTQSTESEAQKTVGLVPTLKLFVAGQLSYYD